MTKQTVVKMQPAGSLEPAISGIEAEGLPNEQKAGPETTQLVTFLLKGEEFGFDIMSVQEIIRLPKMVKMPHTPDCVEGISSLRGTVLPIVDIRARFGMPRVERTDRSRVLVIDIAGRRTGLLVDGVRQVARVEHDEFEPPPASIRSETTDYIDGVVKLEGGARIILALNAARVCNFGEDDGSVAEHGESSKNAHETTYGPSDETGGAKSHGKRSDMQQLVSFQVGREEFAFPIEHVREILRVQAPKGVPGAPDHLLGVLTVRGQILPIVDLRRLLRQSSFAEFHIAACRSAGAGYSTWLQETTVARGDIAGQLHGAQAASEQLRRWLTSFQSSSETLMESMARVRGANDHVSKLVAAVLSHEGKLETAQAEVIAVAEKIVAGLGSFERQVGEKISEDQRIIVVDSHGFQLGLVVDHVNEVLSVPEDAIEAAPNLAQKDGMNLSRIAKLDDGNRLILMLSADSLLDERILADIRDGTTAGAGTKVGKRRGRADVEAVGDQTQAGQDVQLVTFLLGKEEYGIPIAKIQEIDRLSKITQTPKAPRFVEGVTNLRGEVIPVLNTRKLFALEDKVADDRTRVIIVDLGGEKTGLVVDSVKQVLSIATRNIAAPPASILGGASGQFISGIGKVDDGKRMIVLLDVGRVLTDSEQVEVAAMTLVA